MSVNVFISHSTKAIPEHSAFRCALTTRLRQEGFDVFVDEEELSAGAHWRDVIFGKLADCNAAVVLVNERALSTSDWVDTEARIVCWRAWVERKNFRVILVPFGGITRTRIAEHKPWEPLALAEVQMVAAETLDIANENDVTATFNEIATALGSMHDYATGGGDSWIVNTLCGFLPPEVADLKRVAARLGIAPDGPEATVRRAVAKWMYDTGPNAFRTFLDLLVRPIAEKDGAFLLELLSTHWVDPRASTSILRYCGRQATDQLFAINGAKQWFTPQAYVQQLRRSRIVWPVISIDEKRPTSELLGDIRAKLKKVYGKPLGKLMNDPESAEDSVLDSHLNVLLENDAQHDDFVFVALPSVAAHDASLSNAIHAKWKWLRIILCTGTEAGHNPLMGTPMLEPELDIQLEKEASLSYLAAVKHT